MQRTADNPDGLMTRKGVNYASDAKKEMVKGSEQSRILQTVRGADRLARDLAEAFNATRLQLAEFIGLIKESDAKAKEFVREVSAITHGDFEQRSIVA